MKVKNCEVARTIVSNPFWNEEYAQFFAEGATLNYPSAPPGMPQYMDAYDTQLFLSWMRRTVKSWNVEVSEFHSTPDPEIFFSIGFCGGKVFWGQRNGEYHSKYVMMVQVKNEKVVHIRMMIDPLGFLRAAGREVPIFHMDLDNPAVLHEMEHPSETLNIITDDNSLDASEAAIKTRIEKNLMMFVRPEEGESILAPDYENNVYFLPPEVGVDYAKGKEDRLIAWSIASCPDMNFDPNAKIYATDGGKVFFGEVSLTSHTCWLGNDCVGQYRNRYYYVLRFDDLGRLRVYEEYMNPINKFNSINVSIPTFPYFV